MGKISIVGLGPGDYSLISQGALDALSTSSNVYLRTKKHPTVEQLQEKIQYTALDYFYEKEENFEEVYGEIAKFIASTKLIEGIISNSKLFCIHKSSIMLTVFSATRG